jgi:hypothetical protein
MSMTFFVDAADLPIVPGPVKVFAVRQGETGFYPIFTRRAAADLNADNMTPEILESAIAGSMFGWHVPGAALATAYALESQRGRS